MGGMLRGGAGALLLLSSASMARAQSAQCANLTWSAPGDGSDVEREFAVAFALPVQAVPGSVRMVWESPDDSASPHNITLAPEMEQAGEHTFTMYRFSRADEDAAEVLELTSEGMPDGGPTSRDLERGIRYHVTMQATLQDCGNKTSVQERIVRRYDHLWAWGVGASFISSLGSTVGMIIQKYAITRNERRIKVEGKGAPVVCGWTCSWDWWLGFLFMVIVPLPFDMISLALAGQSLNAPLGGVTVFLNQVVAPIFLKNESMSRLDWVATILIVVGVIISTAFGTHTSASYSVDELLTLLTKQTFLICAAVLWIMCAWPAATLALCPIAPQLTTFAAPVIFPAMWVTWKKPEWAVPHLHLVYAFLSAGFGSQQNSARAPLSGAGCARALTEALCCGQLCSRRRQSWRRISSAARLRPGAIGTPTSSSSSPSAALHSRYAPSAVPTVAAA